MKRKFISLLTTTMICASMTVFSTGCFTSLKDSIDKDSMQEHNPDSTDKSENIQTDAPTVDASDLIQITDKDKNTEYDKTSAVKIKLNNSSIDCSSSSVSINGTTATIRLPGTYVVSGKLDDGQIIVDVDKKEDVHLILDGADITCSDNAPIYIMSADKTIITLAENSENILTDSKDLTFSDAVSEEPNATLFSKDNLTINGSGSLTVNANFNNGIQTKNHLKILGGNITVTAPNDALKGKDSVTITDGTFDLYTKGDGVVSSNSEETGLGYIHITGGKFNITADGKGINGATLIITKGGSFDITSVDDAMHSNGDITIADGEFTLTSDDDGIHSDSDLTINAGTISITKSYEGIESGGVTINGGDISIYASDDGINVASGNDNSSTGGMWGKDMFASDSSCNLVFTGGNVYVNCSGDGLDSNGTIEMSGGNVVVYGPDSSANGALDYGISFEITGGNFIATGASGMSENITDSSTQCGALLNFTGSLGGTMITVTDSDNNVIASIKSSKNWGSLNISTPAMKTGETYSIYCDGTISGGTMIGPDCYVGGTLSNATSLGTFTQTDIVFGEGRGMGGPGGMGGMGGPGGMGGHGGR